MKKVVTLLILLLALALVACGGAAVEPTPVPDEVPVVVAPEEQAPAEDAVEPETGPDPAADPLAYVNSLDHVPDTDLIDKTWGWERREQPGVAATLIDDPATYTLTFAADGMFSGMADCNGTGGDYATTAVDQEIRNLFMAPGMSTQIFCGETSQDLAMMELMGDTLTYEILEDGAVLKLNHGASPAIDYYRVLDVTAGSTEPGAAVEDPIALLNSLEHTADPALIDTLWAWERREQPGVAPLFVALPEAYTLTFAADGTYSGTADCNSIGGGYASFDVDQEIRGIFIAPGMSTAAFCGEASQDMAMLELIGNVDSYEILETGTVLKLNHSSGQAIDYFVAVPEVDLPEAGADGAVGTVTAADGIYLRTGPGTQYPYVGVAAAGDSGEIVGISEDGLWFQASVPNQPGGTVWVSADWVEVTNGENLPVVTAPQLALPLVATPWEWVNTTDPMGVLPVDNPESYVVRFDEDGTVNILADCNVVLGSYTVDGNSISIQQGPSTLAQCGPESQDTAFLFQLSQALVYFIDGGNLYLGMPADVGTMRFVPQGTPPPADGPAEEGEGRTFYLVSFGDPDAPTAVLPGTQITMTLSDDTVSGNAGCNNYSAQLIAEDGFFTVGPVVTTRKLCPEPGVMDQEAAFLAALQATGGFEWEQSLVNGTTLVTNGRLFYPLADGRTGSLNFVSTP